MALPVVADGEWMTAREKQKQIPFGNDNKKGIACSGRAALAAPRGFCGAPGGRGEGVDEDAGERQKQIPCGNDNKKSKSKNKSNGESIRVADD